MNSQANLGKILYFTPLFIYFLSQVCPHNLQYNLNINTVALKMIFSKNSLDSVYLTTGNQKRFRYPKTGNQKIIISSELVTGK